MGEFEDFSASDGGELRHASHVDPSDPMTPMTFGGLTHFLPMPVVSSLQVAEFKRDRVGAGKERVVCDNLKPIARKLLILKRSAPSERRESRGEMSEWLKEHAWKAIRASLTEKY
jgi:hypothetical protein